MEKQITFLFISFAIFAFIQATTTLNVYISTTTISRQASWAEPLNNAIF